MVVALRRAAPELPAVTADLDHIELMKTAMGMLERESVRTMVEADGSFVLEVGEGGVFDLLAFPAHFEENGALNLSGDRWKHGIASAIASGSADVRIDVPKVEESRAR